MDSPFHRRPENEKGPSAAASSTPVVPSMKTVIQVLSHGTSDSPCSAIILQTAHGQRHIFGSIGEGFQRTMGQNKFKMGKLKNIFLSGTLDWTSMGGLPGMLLTIADQGVKSIGVHSATKNLAWSCAVWRHFIFRQGIELKPNDLSRPSSYIHEDEFFLVAGIPIESNSADNSQFPVNQEEIDKFANEFVKTMFPENGVSSVTPKVAKATRNPSPSRSASPNRKPSLSRKASRIELLKKLPPLSARDSRSTCYIIQMKPTRGTFQVQKALELGMKKGPLFSQLTKGQSVQLPDGRTITPEQVLTEPTKGPRVLIISCPSIEYVDGVIAQDWLQSLKKPETTDNDEGMQDNGNSPVRKRRRTDELASDDGLSEKPSVVYHTLGKSVDPFSGLYFEWLLKSKDRFSPDCLHFISHPDYAPNGISLDSAALLNIKLRYLYPESFRVLHTADAIKQFPEAVLNSGIDCRQMITLGAVGLEPTICYHDTHEKGNGMVSWPSIESEVLDSLKAKLEEANLSLPAETPVAEIPEEHLREVEVITLGTGSALPSKYRNVVSTLVRAKPGSRKSIMLDCGEATLGNMQRMYGPEMAEKIVKEISILYLSHLHADHHLGAISVIKEWLRVTEDTDQLYVMGPWKYFQFLNEWSQLEPAVNMGRLRFVDNESCMRGPSYLVYTPRSEKVVQLSEEERFKFTNTPSYLEEMKSTIGLTSVRTCKALHCDLAYCVSITFAMEDDKCFQLSYSGDTKPTKLFAYKVGQNSDLLIHEATHENGLEDEAEKKNHSTIGQALDIAHRMKAKYTVLTHFSQRYPKLPDIESTENRAECRVEKREEDDDAGIPDLLEEPEVIGDLLPEEEEQKVALGFDGLQLKLKHIAQQKLKYEQLKVVFAEVENEEAAVTELEKELDNPKKKKKGGK